MHAVFCITNDSLRLKKVTHAQYNTSTLNTRNTINEVVSQGNGLNVEEKKHGFQRTLIMKMQGNLEMNYKRKQRKR